MQFIADQRWFVRLLVAGEAQNYMGNKSQDGIWRIKNGTQFSLLALHVSGCAIWGNFGWMGIWCPYGKSRSEKCCHVDRGQENINKWVWFIHPYHLPCDLFCFSLSLSFEILLITSFMWLLIWATIMKVQQMFEVNCRYCKMFIFVINLVSWTPNFSFVFIDMTSTCMCCQSKGRNKTKENKNIK